MKQVAAICGFVIVRQPSKPTGESIALVVIESSFERFVDVVEKQTT